MNRWLGMFVVAGAWACGPGIPPEMLGTYEGVVAVTGTLTGSTQPPYSEGMEASIVVSEEGGLLVITPVVSNPDADVTHSLTAKPVSATRFELQVPSTCSIAAGSCSGVLTATSGDITRTGNMITGTAAGTFTGCGGSGTFSLTFNGSKT